MTDKFKKVGIPTLGAKVAASRAKLRWLISVSPKQGVVRLHGRRGNEEVRRSFKLPDKRGRFKVGFAVRGNGSVSAFARGPDWGIEMPSFSTAGTLKQSMPTTPEEQQKVDNKVLKVASSYAIMVAGLATFNGPAFLSGALGFIAAEIDYIDTTLAGTTTYIPDTIEDATTWETPATVDVIDATDEGGAENPQTGGGGAGSNPRGRIDKKFESNPEGRYPEDHA
jgi:hypothetical protein